MLQLKLLNLAKQGRKQRKRSRNVTIWRWFPVWTPRPPRPSADVGRGERVPKQGTPHRGRAVEAAISRPPGCVVCAPPSNAAASAASAAGVASAHWQSFPGLRRGTFHRRKVPKMRRELRPPVPRGAPRRASQEKASPGPLRSTGLSHPILPTPSRLRVTQ